MDNSETLETAQCISGMPSIGYANRQNIGKPCALTIVESKKSIGAKYDDKKS
jgi:hypothetical protein